MFFDDLHILRTIDRLEQAGVSSVGSYLLQEATSGQPVSDERDYQSFVRELEMARDCGFLTFKVMHYPGESEPPIPERVGANNYLQQVVDVHLTPLGRDRARSRVYEQAPPEPGEDDGRPITRLTLARIAEILSRPYAPDRLALFLEDGGIPQGMIPPLEDPKQGLLALFSLFDGPSPQRRALRWFFGRWLGQELHSGPNADEERELLADFARQGWYLRDGCLVVGEPLRRAAVAPLLGGDVLANLHPEIQDAARPLFSTGNRAAAVFEAFKAVEVRVKGLVGSSRIGQTLMGYALDGDRPRLRLNQLRSQEDMDEQQGFALIFKGAMTGIRNPKAHARFKELDERRALDYLGFASLLMRRLDDTCPNESEPQPQRPPETARLARRQGR